MQKIIFTIEQKMPKVPSSDDRTPGRGELPGTFGIFNVFSIVKNDIFAFFIKLIWLGVGLLTRAGAEIGY